MGAFVAIALPAAAITNSIVITEKAGVATANYPIQIGRPFMPGEIPNYPKAVIGGTPVTTQADVKQRWSDGSVKHAILSFLIPNLAANSSVTVTFQNQTSGNNTGYLDAAGMQATAFDFEAAMSLTNGSTITASARNMIANGAFTYWLQGSVATTVIIADHSATRAYDIGFDANKAFRPIFHATFWPGINKVFVRFIGENANTEAIEDQSYSLTLTTGKAAPATRYTHSKFTHSAASRWTKAFWLGTAPGRIAIDNNAAYLIATKFVPNYDTSKIVGETVMAALYADWTASAKDFYNNGNLFDPAQPDTGQNAGDHIGLLPAWSVRWILTGDYRMKEIAMGAGELAAGEPIHYREGKTGRFFDKAHTIPALGLPVSIDARPTIRFNDLTSSDTSSQDRITPVGPTGNSDAIGWIPDTPHQHDVGTVQYMLTGDFWYLEELYFWSSWDIGRFTPDPNAGWGRGPLESQGLSNDEVRGQGWSLRTRIHTAFLAPDGSPEKIYLEAGLNDAAAQEEGLRNITGTQFQGNANWTWGRTTKATGGVWGSIGLPPSNIPFVNPGNSGLRDGLDTSKVSGGAQGWEWNFLFMALGRAEELGYPFGKVRQWHAPFVIGQLTDPGYSKYLTQAYQFPVTNASGGWFTSWSAMKAGFLPPLPTGYNLPGTPYPFTYIPAMAYQAGESGGAAAWNVIVTDILSFTGTSTGLGSVGSYGAETLTDNPKWSILPRSAAAPQPPAPFCDVTAAINQALGSATCGTSDVNGDGVCNVVDVQRVINNVLAGACATQ